MKKVWQIVIAIVVLVVTGLFLYFRGKPVNLSGFEKRKPEPGSPEQLAQARAAKAAKAKEKDNVDSEDNNFRSVQAPDKMSPGANQTSRITEEKVLPGREEKSPDK